jgi:uncharacterized protein YkwD
MARPGRVVDVLTGRPARHAVSQPGLPGPGGPPEPDRTSARRARDLVGALVAVLALVAGGLYLAGGPATPPSKPAAAATGAGVGAGIASPAPDACGSAPAGSCAEGPINVSIARVPRTPAAGPTKRSAARPASSSASPDPAASSPAASATPVSQEGTPAGQVLALINQARSAAGLAPLTVMAGLVTSSSAHNMRMVGGCGLTHQCPGEPAIGQRETEAGVNWTEAGENIGEGGPVADTTAAVAQLAVLLTQDMLNEVPPDDGHRLNILSTSFTHIGVAVYRDSSGTVWLTQDFSN